MEDFEQRLDAALGSAIIFIDVDETLVSTQYAYTSVRKPDSIIVEFLGDQYITALRPSAMPFLGSLQNYDLRILTSGNREFQKVILAKHNILNHFSRIYDDDSGDIDTEGRPFVLVDNLPIDTMGSSRKLKQLGGTPDNYVQVHEWTGGQDIHHLTDALPEIMQKLSAVVRI